MKGHFVAEDKHPEQDPAEGSREVVDKNLDRAKKGPKSDAEGQFAATQHGGDNDGTVSANPRVISGDEDGDATFPVKKG
jgi:hypothetical protein